MHTIWLKHVVLNGCWQMEKQNFTQNGSLGIIKMTRMHCSLSVWLINNTHSEVFHTQMAYVISIEAALTVASVQSDLENAHKGMERSNSCMCLYSVGACISIHSPWTFPHSVVRQPGIQIDFIGLFFSFFFLTIWWTLQEHLPCNYGSKFFGLETTVFVHSSWQNSSRTFEQQVPNVITGS